MSFDLQLAFWGVLALVALIIEMTHRTFYLLVVSVACAVGFFTVLLAHAGLTAQLLVVAIAAVIGIPVAGKLRHRSMGLHFPADHGQIVKVVGMRDGRLRVMYRGAEWDALYPGPTPAAGENLKIEKLDGNTLRLTNL